MAEDALPGGQLHARGLLQEGFRPDLGHLEPVQGGEGRGLMGPGWGWSQAPGPGHLQGWGGRASEEGGLPLYRASLLRGC